MAAHTGISRLFKLPLVADWQGWFLWNCQPHYLIDTAPETTLKSSSMFVIFFDTAMFLSRENGLKSDLELHLADQWDKKYIRLAMQL